MGCGTPGSTLVTPMMPWSAYVEAELAIWLAEVEGAADAG